MESGELRGSKIMGKIWISILFVSINLAIALPAFASTGWIIYRESSFKGKVVDSEIKKPIENVVVVAIYKVRKYGIGAGIMSDSAAIDATEVLTNKKGEFYIPSHTFFSFWPFARGEITRFLIFKPGYDTAEGPEHVQLPNGFLVEPNYLMIAEAFRRGATVELLRLKSREEIIKRMMGIPGDFGSKELPLLYKAINEEEKIFGSGKTK